MAPLHINKAHYSFERETNWKQAASIAVAIGIIGLLAEIFLHVTGVIHVLSCLEHSVFMSGFALMSIVALMIASFLNYQTKYPVNSEEIISDQGETNSGAQIASINIVVPDVSNLCEDIQTALSASSHSYTQHITFVPSYHRYLDPPERCQYITIGIEPNKSQLNDYEILVINGLVVCIKSETATLGHLLAALCNRGQVTLKPNFYLVLGIRKLEFPVFPNLNRLLVDILHDRTMQWDRDENHKPRLLFA